MKRKMRVHSHTLPAFFYSFKPFLSTCRGAKSVFPSSHRSVTRKIATPCQWQTVFFPLPSLFVWRWESFGFLPKGEASEQYIGVTPLFPLMCEVATQSVPASCIQYPNWAGITASLWRALLQLHDTIVSEASHAKLPNEKLETSYCLLCAAKIIQRSVTWEDVHLNFGEVPFQFNSFSVTPTEAFDKSLACLKMPWQWH